MKNCPVSKLPITSKPNWKSVQTEAGYVKHLSLIGTNILHACIEADHQVTLSTLNNDLVKTVLSESGTPAPPLYLIWDMHNVKDVSYDYKQGINDLLFHWELQFSVIVFYNIEPACRIITETFAAMVPDTITVLLRDNYQEAMSTIMDFQSGKAPACLPDLNLDEETSMKNEFLATIARISWLNMLNQKVFLPSPDNHYYPYFKAVELMQEDLKAREALNEKELQQLKTDNEQKLTQKIIQLNAQIELNKKELQRFEQERTALKARVAAQEMEMTRISTAIGEKTSALQLICDQLTILDIDPQFKQRLLDQCYTMLDTELKQKRLKTELTAGDSEFLSKLQKKHPNLNQRELRVSLMVKLNYDTREIARSIGISTRGMESIRYRMHRKLGLDKHKSIKTYLSELATGL
ncbi:MAG: transcriptional regulator [Chlorobiaceae bacterium]|nr:transcriptional regulator [Chlorobiaceae bacterium]